MPQQQYISVAMALQRLANKGVIRCHATVINWCRTRGIGHKVAGAWVVDSDKLNKLMGQQPEGTNGQK